MDLAMLGLQLDFQPKRFCDSIWSYLVMALLICCSCLPAIGTMNRQAHQKGNESMKITACLTAWKSFFQFELCISDAQGIAFYTGPGNTGRSALIMTLTPSALGRLLAALATSVIIF